MPGDKIRMEVFAKYVDPNKSDWQANFSDVVSAIRQAGPTPALDGALQRAAGASVIPLTAMLTKAPGGKAPKAYLNYVMYDNDFNPITDPGQTNYVQVSETAKENGRNPIGREVRVSRWEKDIRDRSTVKHSIAQFMKRDRCRSMGQ